jgi:hypothetical protein
MSATVARQEGQEQMEKSNPHLPSNMAKMTQRGCLEAEIEQPQYGIKMFRAQFWQVKKWRAEFPEYMKVMAVMERHPAMLHQNHMNRELPCLNGIAKNPQTHWRCRGTGAFFRD